MELAVKLWSEKERSHYLEYCRKEKANMTNSDNKERLWHHRYGHVGEKNVQRLAKKWFKSLTTTQTNWII